MAKKPLPKPAAHPDAALAGDYLDSTGNRYRVALVGTEGLTQQRRRAGQDWESPYHQEARYVREAVLRHVFTRVEAI